MINMYRLCGCLLVLVITAMIWSAVAWLLWWWLL